MAVAAAKILLCRMSALPVKADIDRWRVSEQPAETGLSLMPSTEGHPVWTEDDCRGFENRWPRGRRGRVASKSCAKRLPTLPRKAA
jgi:hypothetical protein